MPSADTNSLQKHIFYYVILLFVIYWKIHNVFSFSYHPLTVGEIGDFLNCTYLADNVRNEVKDLLTTTTASRVIWDVTAVAWLLNDGNCFMLSRKAPIAMPQYNHVHSFDATRLMEYVYYIKRDALVTDLFNKLTDGKCFE